jgi:hypothetical protein
MDTLAFESLSGYVAYHRKLSHRVREYHVGRLTLMDNNGMGALSYEPDQELKRIQENPDHDQIELKIQKFFPFYIMTAVYTDHRINNMLNRL